MHNDIDLVVTYVDNTEPVWKSVAWKYDITNPENKGMGSEFDPKRFRNWGTFRYWFRGVEKYMPFIRRIHLVVSNIEQVPEWVDQTKVHIVLHRDIIPEKYLPTFNSTTIEMFIPFIDGLSERFIYSNDDMFAMNDMTEEDFFDGDKPCYKYQILKRKQGSYNFQCLNSFNLAAVVSGNNLGLESGYYIRQKHSLSPLLRSSCMELFDKVSDKIRYSVTRFREPFNYTQYLYSDYNILKGNFTDKDLNFQYTEINKLDRIKHFFDDESLKILCLNDTKSIDFSSEDDMYNEKFLEDEDRGYQQIRNRIIDLFDNRFPEKCGFEK